MADERRATGRTRQSCQRSAAQRKKWRRKSPGRGAGRSEGATEVLYSTPCGDGQTRVQWLGVTSAGDRAGWRLSPRRPPTAAIPFWKLPAIHVGRCSGLVLQ